MRASRRLLCLGSLVLGCGAQDTTELPDNPAPLLSARPSAVVFGRVPVGAAARQIVRLANQGRADAAPVSLLANSNVTCDEVGPDTTFCLELPPEPVPAGGSVEAAVVFLPRAPGPPEETAWRIGCGEGCEVTVTGRGSGTDEVLDGPAMIDFGLLRTGCAASQTVTFVSEVDVGLEVEAIELEVDRPGIYGFGLPRALPFVLEPEGELTLDVAFAAEAGDLPAVLRMTFARSGYGPVSDYTLVRGLDIIGRGDRSAPPCE